MTRPAPHSLDAETLFPTDYYAGRDAFLAAAKAAHAKIQTFEHPTARGPGNRPIWIDVATLGNPSAKYGLGFVSGTHGPEGYVGTAAQVGFLTSDLLDRSSDLRIVMLHAHCAYGYAWNSRFNEDNIDLNRNYLDFNQKPWPINEGYEQLAEAIELPDVSPSSLEASNRKMLAYAMENGFPALQAAISAGQYSHPNGLFFGGHAPSWSRQVMESHFVETLRGCERIVIIDWHTGLGPPGYGEVIYSHDPGTERWEVGQAIFEGECRSTKDGSSASADLFGTLDEALERMLQPADTVCVALEFGTIETQAVIAATRATSWLHTRGDRNGPDAPSILATSKAAFYIDTSEWREAVWLRAAWAMDCAVRSLASNAPH
jgi:hypothetical protein